VVKILQDSIVLLLTVRNGKSETPKQLKTTLLTAFLGIISMI